MKPLDGHKVTDDRILSTDWTSIGTRILRAATLASAIHTAELTLAAGTILRRDTTRQGRCDDRDASVDSREF